MIVVWLMMMGRRRMKGGVVRTGKGGRGRKIIPIVIILVLVIVLIPTRVMRRRIGELPIPPPPSVSL